MRVDNSMLFEVAIIITVLTSAYGQSCGDNNLYYDSSSSQPTHCVQNCTTEKYKYEVNKTCLNMSQCISLNSFVNKETGFCVLDCPSDFYQLKQTSNYQCLRTCPSGLYISKSRMACTQNCSNYHQYYDPNTGFCENQCPNDMIRDEVFQKCVYSCGKNTYWLESKNSCVDTCIDQNITINASSLYGDKILQKCVHENECSYNSEYLTQSYANPATRLCVQFCSQNRFAHPDTKKCQTQCSGNYPYKNYVLRTCTASLDQTINDYFKKNLNFQDKVYAISEFQFILIIAGVVFVILIIVLGVIFYKYYLKKKIFRKYLEVIPPEDNIAY